MNTVNKVECISRFSLSAVTDSLNDIPLLLAEIKRLQNENRWIPVAERPPETGEHVFLCCETRPYGGQYVCDGFYAAPKTITCGGGGDSASEYDEEADEYFLLEAWYEAIKNWDDYSSIPIGDFVTRWRPLPKPPEGVEADG